MSQADHAQTTHDNPPPKRRSRRRFMAGMLTGGLLGSLLAGSLSVYSHARHGPGWGPHTSPGGWGHWGHHRHTAHDIESMRSRVEFGTDWILERLNATETQRQQVQTVVQTAVDDLWQMKEQHQTKRQALLDALGQETIDREALGQIRQAELQLVDTLSNRLVTALADVAEVLTPEQRRELMILVAKFRH